MLKSKSGMAAFCSDGRHPLDPKRCAGAAACKGAVKAGILTLLKEAGITSGQVAAVYLAGALGATLT